ncbi:NADH-quinone oxidoreductase subunit J, partial [Psychrobacter sp. 1U2]
DDEITGNDSQNFHPSVGNIIEHESNDSYADNEAVRIAEPYEYKEVDPHDYVGVQRVTRKESD